MGTITLDGILRAEHNLMSEAFMNSGTSNDDRLETFDYIFGVNDLAEQLIRILEGKSGDSDN